MKRKIGQNADAIAAVACGALMGLLFITAISTYEGMQNLAIPQKQHTAPVQAILTIPQRAPTQTVSDQRAASSENSQPVSATSISSRGTQPSPSLAVPLGKQYAIVPLHSAPPKPIIHPAASEESAPVSKPITPASPPSTTVTETPVLPPPPRSEPIASAPFPIVTPQTSPIESPESSNPVSFPAFGRTVFPVSRTPNWGAMTTPAEWNRSYSQMTDADFVSIPRYDLSVLTIPMATLTEHRTENVDAITAKLFYSTRFFGTYDLDAGEFTGTHAGVDLKLARGTPVHAIGGGRVAVVTQTQRLGLHVIVEHRLKNGETFYSIYGHFGSVAVKEGQDVTPGQTVGYVGMTGNTTSPHVHLQIDKGVPGERHIPYEGPPTSTVQNPITFIGKYAHG